MGIGSQLPTVPLAGASQAGEVSAQWRKRVVMLQHVMTGDQCMGRGNDAQMSSKTSKSGQKWLMPLYFI